MAVHSLVMSVAYEQGDKKSKETIMRAIRWEQNPANLKPDVWYPDDDEFSDDREIPPTVKTEVKTEVEFLFMITTEEVPTLKIPTIPEHPIYSHIVINGSMAHHSGETAASASAIKER